MRTFPRCWLPPDRSACARAAKRLLDLMVSASAIALCAPLLLLLVALLIKMEDGGPVFFRQIRLGRSSRFFDPQDPLDARRNLRFGRRLVGRARR
jgi:lipopolysaccharide/colanic/teichoic acid biosynthesis glycosyltransferase